MFLVKIVSECFTVNISELVVVMTLHCSQGVKVVEGQSFDLLQPWHVANNQSLEPVQTVEPMAWKNSDWVL